MEPGEPMKHGNKDPRVERVKNGVAAILTVGLGSAFVLFCIAKPPPPNPLGYELTDSKRYLRDLEMYGGKANILTTEFRTCVTSLSQGRNLAYTVAVLTLVLAFAVWFFASPLPPEPDA